MAIRNALMGGSDMTTGVNTSLHTDWNDTFNSVVQNIKRKVHTAAGEVTTTSLTYADATTFTLSAQNALLLGLHLKFEQKVDLVGYDARHHRVLMKITGASLGEYDVINSGVNPNSYLVWLRKTTDTGTVTETETILSDGTTAYRQRGVNMFAPIKLLDATTTVTIAHKVDTGTAYIKNIAVEAIYSTFFTDV